MHEISYSDNWMRPGPNHVASVSSGESTIALANLVHDRKDAGFITSDDDRSVFINLVLKRNELLRRLVDVRGVGESQLLRQWLNHSNASGRVSKRADERRIDLDGTGSEQLTDAIGNSGVQCASEQCAGGRVLPGLLLLLRIELRLFLCSAQ